MRSLSSPVISLAAGTRVRAHLARLAPLGPGSALAFAEFVGAAPEADYDMVPVGGTSMDRSGSAPTSADVAIRPAASGRGLAGGAGAGEADTLP